MHISRQTSHELVVVSGTRWVSAICQGAALFTLFLVITRYETKGLLLAAFFLLFALIMDMRKTFTFDAMQRVVRWKGRRVFKSESGEISFDEISDIGTEVRNVGERDVPAYRLTIVTARGATPMAYVYSGQPDGYSALRERILGFVRGGSVVASAEGAGSAMIRR